MLYDRHYETVYRYLLRRCRRRVDVAEDLTQTSFCKALDRLSRLREEGAFRPWLLTIARHLLLDRQDEPVHAELQPDAVQDSSAGPDERLLENQRGDHVRGTVRDGLSRLSPRRLRSFQLVVLEGRSQQEAAIEMGMSYEAFRQLFTRARHQLAEHLSGRLELL